MNFLESLLERIAFLWPFAKVQQWEGAVRSTFLPAYPWIENGRLVLRPARVVITVLGPGLHRRIPWVEEFQERPVVQDALRVEIQSLTTADDQSVSLDVRFIYEIEDVLLAVTAVQEFTDSLENRTLMHISERVRELTWDQLRTDTRKLEKSLRDTTTTRAKTWGVKIVEAGITNLVRARQYRLFGRTSI